MAQRVFIKVVGFSDDERHALNTLFRLSEQCLTMYQLWTPDAPEPPKLALLDGNSYQARLEAESPLNADLKLMWVGQDAPGNTWRRFQRPLAWHDVIETMDTLFHPTDLDFELGDLAELGSELITRKRALIVSTRLEERLYMRARLALARLTQADDAEDAGQALELARSRQYDVAMVDFELPDLDAWVLLGELRKGKRPIPHLALSKSRISLRDRFHARMAGVDALLDKPPDPAWLDNWLKRI
jgi:CheY-like chemotaxis protein